MATAKTIEQQILWSINKFEYMSWGISKKAAIEYEGMATLALRVSGAVHKGWAFISLNEGKDCYEVRLLNVARTKVKRTLEEVYCDNLGEVLDGLIERKTEWTDEQYKNKSARDSARKMGMDVIGVSKPKTEKTMAKNEVKFRPATMADIEGRDTDLYMDGEQVWVMMVHRSETIGEGEPKLDYIMLTNMKKVQVEDLQVIDNNNNEPEDKTMATKKNNNNQESVNAANEQQVESVNVGEATIDNIMPSMSAPVEEEPAKTEEPKGDGVEVKQVDVIGLMGALQKNGTAKLSDHATLVVGGMPKPTEKPKVTLRTKTKQTEPDPEAVGELAGMLTRVRLTTFTTKRGETAPRIIGFSGEDDPRWKQHYAERMALAKAVKEAKAKDPKAKGQSDPFGASWMTDHQTGSVTYCMTFGVRYMDVAKQLVEAYNTTDRNLWKQAEQAVIDTKNGIVAGYQAEKAARQAAREAERESRSHQPSAISHQPSSGKTYTAAEMEATIREAFGALAGVLKADAKQFEPLIAAAMKKAA